MKNRKKPVFFLAGGMGIIAIGLGIFLTISLLSNDIQAKDLMAGVKSQNVNLATKPSGDFGDKNLDFAVNLLKNTYESGDNSLLSPISVMTALAMTANGADTTTLEEMKKVLGGYSLQELNENLALYLESVKEDGITNLANSIWFRDLEDRIKVNEDFLQANADYYGADAFASAFDESTLREINDWIEEHTDHLVKNALDSIPPEAVLYLVNTVLFEAKWQEEYTSDMVGEGTFHNGNGEDSSVEYLYGLESTYLEDENATGFMKSYEGGRYAFVAILPNEDLDTYLHNLTGEDLGSLLKNKQEVSVRTTTPKFSYENKLLLKDALMKMGMSEAFSEQADFSKMANTASGELFIGRVLHNTSITLNETGTKAGAVTIVEMRDESAPMIEQEVTLDRPFIYMIYDMDMGVPIFMGVLNQAT